MFFEFQMLRRPRFFMLRVDHTPGPEDGLKDISVEIENFLILVKKKREKVTDFNISEKILD